MNNLTASLPPCVCGNTKWEGAGGSMSRVFHQLNYSCGKCKAPVTLLAHDGGNLLIQGDVNLVLNYVNTTMMAVWRAQLKKLEEAREEVLSRKCKAINQKLGLPEDTTGSTVPDDKRDAWREAMNAVFSSSAYRVPPGFESAPLPPKFPLDLADKVQIFVQHFGKPWVLVDPQSTQTLDIPPDPVRVAHDEYFREVFAALEGVYGKIERVEIRNEYYRDLANNEPWYKFYLKGLSFKLGPRKRVINIEASAEEPFDLTAIRDQAAKDNTTYYANGDWQSSVDKHLDVCVHAWTQEKTISYIHLIVKGR